MSLRFALRPRFRLHESAEPPRRERRKLLPPVVLPIAGYWLGMAALTHVLILVGRGEAAESGETTAAAEPPAQRAESAFERVREEPSEPTPVTARAPTAASERRTSEPEVDAPPRLPSKPPEMDAPPPRSPGPAEPDARTPLDAMPPRAALAARSDRPRDQDRDEPPLDLPASPPPRTERESAPVSSGLPSCESFAETSSQSIDFDDGKTRAPDLAEEAFSRVLNHGGYLSACSIPDGTALDICVAVQAGQVRGVSVQTRPHDPRVSACVARAAARLRFPHSPHLDIARTRFDPSR